LLLPFAVVLSARQRIELRQGPKRTLADAREDNPIPNPIRRARRTSTWRANRSPRTD